MTPRRPRLSALLTSLIRQRGEHGVVFLGLGRLLLALALCPLTAYAQYRADSWTVEEGLPQNSVRSICQTGDGYLWLATFDGLARFDGVRFTVFDKSNTPGIGPVVSPPDPRAGTIPEVGRRISYEDRQRHLWTLAVDPNLTRILTFLLGGQPAGIPFDALFEDRKGNIWLGTDGQGLFRMRRQSVTVYSTRRGLVAQNAYPVYEDRFGAIWVGAWPVGLSRFKDGAFTNFTSHDGLLSGALTVITEERDGRLWVAGVYNDNGSLQVLDNRGGVPFGHFASPGAHILPAHTNVAVIHQDEQGPSGWARRAGWSASRTASPPVSRLRTGSPAATSG